MTTYTLSRTSPKNTTLTDPGGAVAYEISSTYHLGSSDTTIKKGDQTLAIVHWKPFQRSTITWNGRTTTIKEIFPRSTALSTSRVYTIPSGEKFKWKNSSKLYCVSVDTGLNLATYDRTLFYLVRSKKSTLDITSSGAHFTDDLVVTWAIAEKKARDRRRSRRHGGGGGGGGDGGG
ncbi:unnamed protein product [Rhizoctonia solani]|uniref:DUF6593 domain-containing protein n=1 Tax=Rhizoctonia solani TaxID=456999 RepID=A0A8H3H8P8_9AGAM|nr:unnamed protein product [Rhizoctonia solani]